MVYYGTLSSRTVYDLVGEIRDCFDRQSKQRGLLEGLTDPFLISLVVLKLHGLEVTKGIYCDMALICNYL